MGQDRGASQTVRETEVKLAPATIWRMPRLQFRELPTADPARRASLTATYYDTADRRLARWGITLRRRTGGTDAGWHAKLPVTDVPDARDEIRLPLSTGRRDVPAELADLLLAFTRGAPLEPLATVRTRRATTVLRDAAGAPQLEVCDDRVTITDGPLDGTAYREVEVESLAVDAPLAVVVDALVEAGAPRSTAGSKGIRAVAGAGWPDPEVPEPGPVSPADPAAAAVLRLIRAQTRAIIAQDLRVRRDLPDAVHQFRVATRRLRSGLQAFAPLVDRRWAKQIRAELGWAASALGAARDAEVLEERLEAGVRALDDRVDRAAALVAVRDAVLAGQSAALRAGREALMSARYLALLDALVAASNDVPLTAAAGQPAGQVLPALVLARWDNLAEEADRLADELDGHDDDWHQTRISAKKARYAAESLVPVFGEPAKRLAQQLGVVTDLLGRHQDCSIAAETVAALITPDTGPRAAFALGALHEQQRAELQQVRHDFVRVWPEIARRRHRKWLVAS
jgi:CHAD domain-containing protein